ncbi:MAG: alpha/beta hydrolase, partial [Muribaculaceae bacterium]|nr:alpha/beta hydrolase [Muribaculaceae bacterium]
PGDNGHDNTAMVTVYHPRGTNSGKAVVICPGGAYEFLAMDHEGRQIADLLADHGVTSLVLKYRFPHGNDTIPATDARRALKLVRENAEEWGVNPSHVGIVGSSAGGHLASTVSTHHPDPDAIPNFAILFYPVISVKPELTHSGSANNLLGSNIGNQEYITLYSNEEQVTPATPPTLLLLSGDDAAVPAENSLLYYKSLIANGVPAEMHVYPVGGHGWGMNTSFPYHKEMTDIHVRYVSER